MNMKVGMVVGSLLSLLISGCSTTQFQTPNYYDTKLAKKNYPAGVNVDVSELRCSENKIQCNNKTSKTWKTHRKYNQPYYFSD